MNFSRTYLISTDKQNATALVAYQWYLTGQMSLLYTVVQQRWAALGDGYGLVSVRSSGIVYLAGQLGHSVPL